MDRQTHRGRRRDVDGGVMTARATATASRLTEAQKRSVACPKCCAAAGKPCRGSRIPGANTFGGGWGGPPDLDRAHDERRAEALRTQATKIVTSSTYGKPGTATRAVPSKRKPKLVTVIVKFARNSALVGRVFTLAPRVEVGLVPCTGEAHSNAFIDNCMVCAPRWGEMMSYEPMTPAACQEGFAVPYGDGDQKAFEAAVKTFEAAEKAGAITLVTVSTKSSSFSAWVATGCVAHSDCAATPALGRDCAGDARPIASSVTTMSAAWPRRCSGCGHVHAKAEDAKHSAAGFFCTWCGDNASALEAPRIDPRCAPSLAGGLNPHGTADNGHLPGCECEPSAASTSGAAS